MILAYYFQIWKNIEKSERGSLWRRFVNNAPASAKAVLVIIILCLVGMIASTLLPSKVAVIIQIVLLVLSLVLSFSYSILLNKFKRKSALGDLGNAIIQVERIRRKFIAQTGLTLDALEFVLEEVQRFSSIRREARKTFTDRAYAALIVGIFVTLLARLTDMSTDPQSANLAATLFVVIGFVVTVLMPLSGPLWDWADQKNELPLESVELFSRDIGLMIMIERGCKPQNTGRS